MAKYRVKPMRGHSFIVDASSEGEAAMLWGKHHEIDGPTEVHVSLVYNPVLSYVVYKKESGTVSAQLKVD